MCSLKSLMHGLYSIVLCGADIGVWHPFPVEEALLLISGASITSITFHIQHVTNDEVRCWTCHTPATLIISGQSRIQEVAELCSIHTLPPTIFFCFFLVTVVTLFTHLLITLFHVYVSPLSQCSGAHPGKNTRGGATLSKNYRWRCALPYFDHCLSSRWDGYIYSATLFEPTHHRTTHMLSERLSAISHQTDNTPRSTKTNLASCD